MEQPNPDEPIIDYRRSQRRSVVIGVTIAVLFLAFAMAILFFVQGLGGEKSSEAKERNEPKNLVLIIADGMGVGSMDFTRQMGLIYDPVSHPKPLLPLDHHLVGMARTGSTDRPITDSAAGATAYSCFRQTDNSRIATTPDNKACATILEAAKQAGFATGIVTNTRVTHATPASFSAHTRSRGEEEEIARQQTYNFSNSMDLLFGGGRNKFTERDDGENMLEVFTKNQIQILNNSADLVSATLPAVGLFAGSHLDYTIDRIHLIEDQTIQQQPFLSQMVEKALSLLAHDGRRFILVIESGRIDHSSHHNDPASHYHEMNEYMNTIRVIEDFLERDPQGRHTTVFATSDHETGGIGTYSVDDYRWNPSAILDTKVSMAMLSTRLLNGDVNGDFNDVYLAGTGINLQESFPEIYHEWNKSVPVYDLGELALPLIKSSGIGFITQGHTGMDIPVYNFGIRIPGVSGVMRNYQFGEKIGEAMGLMVFLNDLNNQFSDWVVPKRAEEKSVNFPSFH
mmetsp:Transcript_19301/g.26617  ORF Transcript_19301/g.26617 Transcript_19301/m.26617 type:complete len:511 (+) Transcript_19301:38-1570(+)